MQTTYCLSKVLDYIEQHLCEKLELEDLGDVANYSPWHFHRLFTAYVGYGVGDYVRRRRMSEASRELVFTSIPIKEIAQRYGFDSQEAFTRAIKSFCGATPGAVRSMKGPLIRFSPINLTQYAKHIRKGAIMLTPRMEHKDAFTTVGIAGKFTMSNNTIPQLWDSFNLREKEISNAGCEACYGVCFFEKDYDKEKDSSFIYMAAKVVSSTEDIPEGMVARTIPSCDYAVFEHHGSLDTLGKSYDQIFREWLPTSEYDFANQDDFEVYDERFEYGKPESVMEIWIPVKKK